MLIWWIFGGYQGDEAESCGKPKTHGIGLEGAEWWEEVPRATRLLSSAQKEKENIDKEDWCTDSQCPMVKGDLPVVYPALALNIDK